MPLDVSGGFARKLAYIAVQNTTGAWRSYAVRRLKDGVLIGSSSYMAIVPADARLEIGATWLVAEARGTAANPEAKLLMLENAFRAGYNRVEFKTDSNNVRSRAALAKLGATEEGTLRGHMWMPQGYFRDSVYFSILAAEWPGIRAGLERRLARFT